MAQNDDDLLYDEEGLKRELAYIREQLPSDLKEKYADDDLEFITDAIGEYFFDSGILETGSDEVDVDLEVIADYVCQQAKAEGRGPYDAQEVFFVVEADLDFQEQD